MESPRLLVYRAEVIDAVLEAGLVLDLLGTQCVVMHTGAQSQRFFVSSLQIELTATSMTPGLRADHIGQRRAHREVESRILQFICDVALLYFNFRLARLAPSRLLQQS